MKVRMIVEISGTRDGEEWPKRGEVIDLPEAEALDYIAAGLCEADTTPAPVTETATVEPVKETAARKPGRPRKTAE